MIPHGSERQCLTIFENLSSLNTDISGNENASSGENENQREPLHI